MGMILLIVLIAAAIWWFTKGAGSKDGSRLPRETPLDILKKRYTKGEITQDEFEKIKRTWRREAPCRSEMRGTWTGSK